jgi:hypothetical protein
LADFSVYLKSKHKLNKHDIKVSFIGLISTQQQEQKKKLLPEALCAFLGAPAY